MKRNKVLSTILFLLISVVITKSQNVTIPIITENLATILQTDENNRLKIVYFGKSLTNVTEYERVGKPLILIRKVPTPIIAHSQLRELTIILLNRQLQWFMWMVIIRLDLLYIVIPVLIRMMEPF